MDAVLSEVIVDVLGMCEVEVYTLSGQLEHPRFRFVPSISWSRHPDNWASG